MRSLAKKICLLVVDDRGQAMTEFVILTAVITAVAAYLYYPDNEIFQAIRLKHDRALIAIGHPGP